MNIGDNAMGNADMKAKETAYNGHTYPSKLQAQQAVYMDEAGFKYEIEPERFDVGDGLQYRPDFLLYGAWFLSPTGLMRYLGNVYVEVKGKWKKRDTEKVERLCLHQDKNVLTVDNILWPGRDYYDEMYDTTLYRILAEKMRETKKEKEEHGVGSSLHEFSLFVARKCDACSYSCKNVVISSGSTEVSHEICHQRFHDMALCVGIHGEPVICGFIQDENESSLELKAEEFARICDIEKTRTAYLAACQAFDDNGDECCGQASGSYGSSSFDDLVYDDELPF